MDGEPPPGGDGNGTIDPDNDADIVRPSAMKGRVAPVAQTRAKSKEKQEPRIVSMSLQQVDISNVRTQLLSNPKGLGGMGFGAGSPFMGAHMSPQTRRKAENNELGSTEGFRAAPSYAAPAVPVSKSISSPASWKRDIQPSNTPASSTSAAVSTSTTNTTIQAPASTQKQVTIAAVEEEEEEEEETKYLTGDFLEDKAQTSEFLAKRKNEMLLLTIHFVAQKLRKKVRVPSNCLVEEAIHKIIKHSYIEEDPYQSALYCPSDAFWLLPKRRMWSYMLTDEDILEFVPKPGKKNAAKVEVFVKIDDQEPIVEFVNYTTQLTGRGLIRCLSQKRIDTVNQYGLFFGGNQTLISDSRTLSSYRIGENARIIYQKKPERVKSMIGKPVILKILLVQASGNKTMKFEPDIRIIDAMRRIAIAIDCPLESVTDYGLFEPLGAPHNEDALIGELGFEDLHVLEFKKKPPHILQQPRAARGSLILKVNPLEERKLRQVRTETSLSITLVNKPLDSLDNSDSANEFAIDSKIEAKKDENLADFTWRKSQPTVGIPSASIPMLSPRGGGGGGSPSQNGELSPRISNFDIPQTANMLPSSSSSVTATAPTTTTTTTAAAATTTITPTTNTTTTPISIANTNNTSTTGGILSPRSGSPAKVASKAVNFNAESPPAATSIPIEAAPSSAAPFVNSAHISNWSIEDVASWIESLGFPELKVSFLENMISGADLLELSADDLKNDLGISALGIRKRILSVVQEYRNAKTGEVAEGEIPTPISSESSFSSIAAKHSNSSGTSPTGVSPSQRGELKKAEKQVSAFGSTLKKGSLNNSHSEKRLKDAPLLSTATSYEISDGPPSTLNLEVVEKLIKALDEKQAWLQEGIFRLSGSKKDIKDVWRNMNMGSTRLADDIHAISGALKMYIRDLPSPLIPFDMYNIFITIVKDDSVDLHSMRAAIKALPSLNRDVLDQILFCCQKILQHSERNKMNEQNLGIVWGPTIMRCRTQDGGDDLFASTKIANIFASMLSHQEEIMGRAPLKWDSVKPQKVDLLSSSPESSRNNLCSPQVGRREQQTTPKTDPVENVSSELSRIIAEESEGGHPKDIQDSTDAVLLLSPRAVARRAPPKRSDKNALSSNST